MDAHIIGKDYSARVEEKIWRKSLKRIRAAIRLGEQSVRPIVDDVTTNLHQGVLLLRKKKIDGIIVRAEEHIKNALLNDPSIVVAMVNKLFRNIAEHTDVEITAHPDDVMHIKATAVDYAHAYTSVRKIAFKEDENVDRGSLIIKANKSIIDAHVQTQLERARAIILQRLEDTL